MCAEEIYFFYPAMKEGMLYQMIRQLWLYRRANEIRPAGYYTLNLKAGNLSNGIYFYRINAEGENSKGFISTKKMMLIK